MITAIEILKKTYEYLRLYKDKTEISPESRQKWALETLELLQFEVHQVGSKHSVLFQNHLPLLIVSNHISYLDIVALMATVDDCAFVSKKEIGRWPLFGTAAKKMGTVFVDRNSKRSQSEARIELQEQFLKHNKKIVVFPSGTTKIAHEMFWKKGSFEIAKNLGLQVVPVRLNYTPLREVAYIDDDFFPWHFYKLTNHSKIKNSKLKLEIEFHEPIKVQNVMEDLEYCRLWCNTKRFKSKFLQYSLPTELTI